MYGKAVYFLVAAPVAMTPVTVVPVVTMTDLGPYHHLRRSATECKHGNNNYQ
jgi:hypothetical protein